MAMLLFSGLSCALPTPLCHADTTTPVVPHLHPLVWHTADPPTSAVAQAAGVEHQRFFLSVMSQSQDLASRGSEERTPDRNEEDGGGEGAGRGWQSDGVAGTKDGSSEGGAAVADDDGQGGAPPSAVPATQQPAAALLLPCL